MSSTEMDGFVGCAVAADSILDTTTILHGPGGCRIHMSRLSARYLKRDFKTREGDYFFHHERIPCTFIDRDDYIYGASKKVSMVLDLLENEDTKFATIIQSPGASLIGDKLKDEVLYKGLDYKTVVLDTSFMSEKFSVGFDTTLTKIAEKIVRPAEKEKNTVNIIGLPFTSRGYYGYLKELTGLLESMGLKVIAAIGAGCTLDELRRSSAAEYNLCIYPEYCKEISGFYEDVYGIKTIRCPEGAPIGYYALASFIESIGKSFGIDVSRFIADLEHDRKIVDITIDSSMAVGELLNYKTFSIEGESSVIHPLMTFMIRFLKMVPQSIVITESDEEFVAKIKDLLERMGRSSALEEEFGKGYTNILFGPGAYVKLLESQGACGIGVDINLPSRDMIDISTKSILGLDGLHKMLDDVLNSR